MTLERCYLASVKQEQVVEIRSEFAQPLKMRKIVVIGNCDKVKLPRTCRFQRLEQRARNLHARFAHATAIATSGMHVQITAIPGRPFFSSAESPIDVALFRCPGEMNL